MDVQNRYYEWLTEQAIPNGEKRWKYSNLLNYLYSIPFSYTMELDENRYQDGIDFRYYFGYVSGTHPSEIATYIDNRECSILEMMIALVCRCEEHIMYDPDIGNRAGEWFMDMLISLGLDTSIDNNFDYEYVDNQIKNWLSRNYEYNGRGSLFTLNRPRTDMRSVCIWYQAMWYFEEKCEELIS